MKVNIIGLHKALVLEALYNGALYQAGKFDVQPAIRKLATQREATPFLRNFIAHQLIKEQQQARNPHYQFGTVDLGMGPRELAVDLSGFEVDVSVYNELHGVNAAQKIIAELYGVSFHEAATVPVIENENNLFYAAIQKNRDWLQPMLLEILQLSGNENDKEKSFVANVGKMISANQVIENYERKPEQAIYLAWINVLNPQLEVTAKEAQCAELAQCYLDDQRNRSRAISISGTLAYMSSRVAVPILLYAPLTVLSEYHDYQRRYKKIASEVDDENFDKTLTVLVNHDIFPNVVVTLFLRKLMTFFKQHYNRDDALHEAMACWERSGLMVRIAAYFDAELTVEYDKFKEKIVNLTNDPAERFNFPSELGSLVIENLLIKFDNNAEKLTPVVMQLIGDGVMPSLAAIYDAKGLAASLMLQRHLVQLAKLTNEPDQCKYSSSFFSSCLKYLGKEAKSIVEDIASQISAQYYAEHMYVFESIRREMFDYWIEQRPGQIVAVAQAVLAMKKSQHETPISSFLSKLIYCNMSENFYDKFAMLLSLNLTPSQFISIYSDASEELQRKLLSAILVDEGNALTKLAVLSATYQAGDFSALVLRKMVRQLKAMHPILYAQAEAEKLFTDEDAKNDVEADLRLLQKIVANESLTHDERRSELGRLENLHAALRDKNTDTCPVVIRMFNHVTRQYWPDLLVYFDAQIIHWSFPEDEQHLARFYPDAAKRPAPRKNTWLDYQASWEAILNGCLEAILADLSKNDLGHDIASWALTHIDEAFAKAASYFPESANIVLKRFFLDNAPHSIKLFMVLHDRVEDKYHPLQFFSQEHIYDLVASWLPDDTAERASLLAQLLQMPSYFSPALHYPFVRNRADIDQVVSAVMNAHAAHFVNFLDVGALSSDALRTLFKSCYQRDQAGFLIVLQKSFSDLGKAGLHFSTYMSLVGNLLSLSKGVGIDIFSIIDADPNKDNFLDIMSDAVLWEKSNIFSRPYELMFILVQHYRPHQMQDVIVQHVQHYMPTDNEYHHQLFACLEAAHKIAGHQLILLLQINARLVSYLTQQVPVIVDSPSRHLEVMAAVISDVDQKILMHLMQEKFSPKITYCLDNLVRVYGFSHVHALCLDLKFANGGAYLVGQFGKFPELLQQIDEVVKTYHDFLGEHVYKVDWSMEFSFHEELRSAIRDAAKSSESNTIVVPIAEIGAKAGLPADLQALLPPLSITLRTPLTIVRGALKRLGIFSEGESSSSQKRAVVATEAQNEVAVSVSQASRQ